MTARKLVSTRLMAVLLVGIFVVDLGVFWQRHTRAKPVTVSQAVERFRHDLSTAPDARSLDPSKAAYQSKSRTAAHAARRPSGSRGPAAAVPRRHRRGSTKPTATAPTPTPQKKSEGLPPPIPTPIGVYTYATTGSEQVSVPGSKRTFPSSTTITVTRDGCGVSADWEPFNQHSETRVICVIGNAIRLSSYQSRIGFYGITNNQSYSCPDVATVFTTSVKPGDTSTFTCASPNAQIKQTYTAIGFETLHVGGVAVKTLHFHVLATLTGSNSGSSSQDFWYATKSMLLVRNIATITATQSGVHYKATFTLLLDDLTPRT